MCRSSASCATSSAWSRSARRLSPFDIYIKERAVLERTHRIAYEAIGAADELANDPDAKGKKKRKGSEDSVRAAREWMCKNFFDVRNRLK